MSLDKGFDLTELDLVPRLYEGTRVHHQVHQLTSFLEHQPSQEELYQTMLAVVHQASKPSETHSRGPALSAWTPDQQPWHRDEDAASEACDEIRALEDLHLEEQVSVRTRHKKEGKKGSNNPVLVRKVERRGPHRF